MNKTYKFIIWESKTSDGYLADLYVGNKKVCVTQGDDLYEMFCMVADAYCCIEDIEVSKWEKFWHKVLRLK